MKKIVFLFAVIFTLSFSASAQFSFTSNAGKKFNVSSAPQRTENRGGGFVMEFYYTVEGSDLVVYEVAKTKGVVSNSIAVIKVSIDKIKADKFKAKTFNGYCYLQTGTTYTKITHGADYNSNETYTGDNLQLDFKTCDDAEELRKKVLGDAAEDLDLSDLDLDLDKPKEKPKSTMPAHLFALIGTGSKGFYQFNRKNMEIWDYKTNNVFKVGKIVDSGSQLKMLNAEESYFTYNVKDGKLYNGAKYLDIKLINDNICKSGFDQICFEKWEIDRDNEHIYRVFDNGKTRYEQYKIKGEATNEEILLIFAYLEKF